MANFCLQLRWARCLKPTALMSVPEVQLARQFSAFIRCKLVQPSTTCYVPRRFRYKKKWAVNRKPRGPCELALENFDAFYKPVYGEWWPLIRLCLLSLPKYCAAINKYADPITVHDKLSSIGAEDFVCKARNLQSDIMQHLENGHPPKELGEVSHAHTEAGESKFDVTSVTGKEVVKEIDPRNTESSHEHIHSLDPEIESLYDDMYKDNVDVFVPTTKVLSVKDQLMREEISVNTFQARDIEVAVQKPTMPIISHDVCAMMFPSGNMSRFSPTRSYSRRLGYYLMDAASVLPVLALNIQPTDIVLDLCAAPGGKSVLILQSLDLLEGGHLHCNEFAKGRVERLRDVLESYFPRSVVEEVEITQMDGTAPHQPVYSKVLVDVPCNADRHVVNEEDNNLFRPVRTRERLGLMSLQTKLLISAIKSCKVGGEIVYSTCTLAPAQNDGVIQAAVEELTETSNIEVVVQDMSEFISFFKDSFNFHDKSRYGQTVIPDLLNNSGPSYFAKMVRTR